jgi:hypothetical protein
MYSIHKMSCKCFIQSQENIAVFEIKGLSDLAFFPEIGSNWLILNISTFLRRFKSNVESDYLHMFRSNSYIHQNHYLSKLW